MPGMLKAAFLQVWSPLDSDTTKVLGKNVNNWENSRLMESESLGVVQKYASLLSSLFSDTH